MTIISMDIPMSKRSWIFIPEKMIESADYAIANVQCHYDSPSDTETEPDRPVVACAPTDDHTYDTRDEPPAFIIQQINAVPSSSQPQVRTTQGPFLEVTPRLGSGFVSSVNVIHVAERTQVASSSQQEYNTKRIRRSEVVLRQAAECVSKGLTFQTVSEQFNIPISTIRFFMARKGILPKRRRGRNTQLKPCTSPEPPFHMQHFKLPDMIAMKAIADDEPTLTS
ncbi:uncharacterized protein ACR2FA_010009 [Aphomia sociella]